MMTEVMNHPDNHHHHHHQDGKTILTKRQFNPLPYAI